MNLSKRGFLATASLLGAAPLLLAPGIAAAQDAAAAAADLKKVPHRRATTRLMFKAPSGFPNALASAPEGLWVAEQKPRGNTKKQYGLTYSDDSTENVWLMDANGKVLKTLVTDGRNCSGLALGNGNLWSCGLAVGGDGVYQLDINTGKTLSRRQVPLGPAEDGGSIHGAFWQAGKLWVFSNRLNAMMRIDPVSWTPEFMIPVSGMSPRYHGIAWDNGTILIVTANVTKGYSGAKFGLERYDPASGRLTEIIDFEDGSADPHGLTVHNGKIVSCDAGIHPGWPVGNSPTWGNIFEINLT